MAKPSIDLSTYDQTTLARWWCELNIYRWPADFPIPKPEGWDAETEDQKWYRDELQTAWDLVTRAVDREDALAYWNGPFQQGRFYPPFPWLPDRPPML
jgi:hypothetical protein